MTWDPSALGVNGTLRVWSAIPPGPVFTSVNFSGASLILQGANGLAGAPYAIPSTTNLAWPVALWTTSVTDNCNGTGGFSNALPVNAADPQRYFRLGPP